MQRRNIVYLNEYSFNRDPCKFFDRMLQLAIKLPVYTMTTALENFITITHRDFNWPYPVPLITKPAQPPKSTGIRLYTPRIDPEDCSCDEHGQQSNKDR